MFDIAVPSENLHNIFLAGIILTFGVDAKYRCVFLCLRVSWPEEACQLSRAVDRSQAEKVSAKTLVITHKGKTTIMTFFPSSFFIDILPTAKRIDFDVQCLVGCHRLVVIVCAYMI